MTFDRFRTYIDDWKPIWKLPSVLLNKSLGKFSRQWQLNQTQLNRRNFCCIVLERALDPKISNE